MTEEDCREHQTVLQEKPEFKFRETNTLELLQLENRMQVDKASGVKGISSYLLKLCLRSTLDQLEYLMTSY